MHPCWKTHPRWKIRSRGLLVTALPLSFLLFGCQVDATGSADSAESETARPTGSGEWISLFDGRSFDGWRALGGSEVPTQHWRIEDDAIHKIASGDVPTAADGQPLLGGDLRSDLRFRDFELRFEWRVAPGANSGIKYNVSEALSLEHEPTTAALGFEYQVLDDERHPDAANGQNRTAGALYDLVEPRSDKPLRPVGEYNEGRIVLRGDHGEHWLNGAKILEFDMRSDDFRERYARSKYAPLAGFDERRSGHIVLQDHGDDVWFRNLRIRRLGQE